VSPDSVSTTASGLASGTRKQLWTDVVTYSAKAADPLQVTASPTFTDKHMHTDANFSTTTIQERKGIRNFPASKL
jgi:hypothetical protein